MPIEKKPNETKEEFVSRCIGYEIENGYEADQAAAICYNKWESFKLDDFRNKRLEKFEKIRSYVDSSNVDRVMFNTETNEMTVKFTNGDVYTYRNITEDIFNKILDGVDAPITTDTQRNRWREGVGPSVGATLYKRVIQKGFPYEKGGSFR